MPFPSAGCLTCKIRRIKCDETKPTCQRCNKSRLTCLETSAAKQASFSIHVENRYASGKVKRPRGPRSSLTARRPQFDLQTLALAYYVQFHLQALIDVPSVSGGLSECVTAWKASGRSCGMVDLALASMALAVFSRTQQHPAAATEASSTYYRLLRVAQAWIAQLTVPQLDERSIDACLLAVSLMGRYEGATYRPGDVNSVRSFSSLQSWSHHDGAMAILKVWHDTPNHHAATFIIKQTRRGLIKSRLLRNLALPDWLMDGSRFGERELELDFDRILVRIVNLHHAVADLERKNRLQISRAEELNNDARELDEGMRYWAAQIPSTCSYRRHILAKPATLPTRHFYSAVAYSYPRPGYAAAWSHYFALRMLINSTRLRILDLSLAVSPVDMGFEKQRRECTTRLSAMADSLASSIPFCLERFKVDDTKSAPGEITVNADDEIKPSLASLAAWPLTIASSLEQIDARQQQWFRSELALLGRLTGDGVLECAETDQWATL